MASSRITGTNENISTYGNGTRDFTSLITWEAATDNDLVTATQSEVLECYADSASFDDGVTISGATTSSDYFRIIRAADGEGHDGTPGSGVIFSTSAIDVFLTNEANFSFQDLVAINTNISPSDVSCFNIANAANGVSIIGCIAKASNSGAGAGTGYDINGTNIYVINCLAYECKTRGFWSNTPTPGYFYNCTSVDNGVHGFVDVAGSQSVVVNCLGSDNGTADFAFSATTTGSVFNASSDASAIGTNSRVNQTFTFVDADNDDYHLADNDEGARGFGTSLAVDSTFAFNDDIDGMTRRLPWSIGMDEYVHSSRVVANNENVSTYDSAGGQDYTSLATWEAATDIDLVSAEQSEVLECHNGPHEDTVSLAGATTNEDYFRVIRPAEGEGHNGTPNTGVKFDTSGATFGFDLNENYSSLSDLILTLSVNSASTYIAYLTRSNRTGNYITNCIAANCVNANNGGYGFAVQGINTLLANCIALNCTTYGFLTNSATTGVTYLNCTAADSGRGFRADETNSPVVVIKNCLAHDNTIDFEVDEGVTITGSSHNASSDATAPGTSARTNQTFEFVEASNDDYRITDSDTGAHSHGVSLLDYAPFAFYDDIQGEDWAATWSIGANEPDSLVRLDAGDFPAFSYQRTPIIGHGFFRRWTAS